MADKYKYEYHLKRKKNASNFRTLCRCYLLENLVQISLTVEDRPMQAMQACSCDINSINFYR